MNKILTFSKMFSLVVMFAAFTTAAQAQQAASQANSQTGTKQQATAGTVNQTAHSATAVYLNYKGLTDPRAAKEAWVKDNPELYKKMTQTATSPASTDNKK